MLRELGSFDIVQVTVKSTVKIRAPNNEHGRRVVGIFSVKRQNLNFVNLGEKNIMSSSSKRMRTSQSRVVRVP